MKYNNLEACYYGMDSIVNNAPNTNLINDKLLKDLQDITFKVDRIHLVKALDSFSCDVFTTDPKGVRRYQVSLEKSSRFAHLYRLIDVKEKKVSSRYQL